MKKLITSLVLGLSICVASSQQNSNTNYNFLNITFDVYGLSTVGNANIGGALYTGEIVAPAATQQPIVALCLSNAASVVSAGTLTGSQLLVVGASDTCVSIVVSNGSLHAWTNTYGQILLTNTFATPRLNTNYSITVLPFQYVGSSVNPYTYCPPSAFSVSNLTTTNFLLVSTGAGTALPLSTQLGIQYSVGQ